MPTFATCLLPAKVTMQTRAWTILLAIFCAMLGSAGQVLLKVGSRTVTVNVSSWVRNAPLVAGIALYAASAILFVIALKHGRLSVLYPVIATSYVWVAIISSRLLGEAFSLLQWMGIALILAGVSLVVLKG